MSTNKDAFVNALLDARYPFSYTDSKTVSVKLESKWYKHGGLNNKTFIKLRIRDADDSVDFFYEIGKKSRDCPYHYFCRRMNEENLKLSAGCILYNETSNSIYFMWRVPFGGTKAHFINALNTIVTQNPVTFGSDVLDLESLDKTQEGFIQQS